MMHLGKDARVKAESLRRWSKMPLGDFFKEDLEDAAEMLVEYAKYLSSLRRPSARGKRLSGGDWGHVERRPNRTLAMMRRHR